jgi:hypothetical protein
MVDSRALHAQHHGSGSCLREQDAQLSCKLDSMAVDTTEDHVSMGCVSARKAMDIIANTANVLAIELISAAQAIDLHSPVASSPPRAFRRDCNRRERRGLAGNHAQRGAGSRAKSPLSDCAGDY